MTTLYLDQNLISDLRPRKLASSSKDLHRLHDLLQGKNCAIVISPTHLQEIHQIQNDKYIKEHIDVLQQLDVKYIRQIGDNPTDCSFNDIWNEYLNNVEENISIGVSDIVEVMELIGKNTSGIPTPYTLKELLESLKRLTLSAYDTVDRNVLTPEECKSLDDEIRKANSIDGTSILKNIETGPKPFRESNEVSALQIMNREPGEVITIIQKVFIDANPNYDWDQFFNVTLADQISKCYTLMNWCGYYADDFTKVKKKNDRYKASFNDQMHCSHAITSEYLISNDNKLRMKALACYLHLGIKTKPISLDNYLASIDS